MLTLPHLKYETLSLFQAKMAQEEVGALLRR